MNKPLLISVGFVGLGLVLFGFTNKNAINTEYLKTETDKMFNILDKNLALSNTQIKTLAKQIREQNAGAFKKHIQIGTWKGLLSLELEAQLAEKDALNFEKMQTISASLDKAFDTIISYKNRAISLYCQQNSFEVSNPIYTIETNLIKLAQAL